MKLTFIGAAHEVTGSCSLLEACGYKILIDCGMEQGLNIYDNIDLPCSASEIDCVLLTHAHIDHSGKIPLLAGDGFSGQIFATEATTELCSIMLLDSAHIQQFEALWRNRKAKRAGKNLYQPLYTVEDVQKAMPLFVPCKYNDEIKILDGSITIKFIDAGHLLGSSSIEVNVTESGITETIVFSGDIGNVNRPLIRDPSQPDKADYVVIESTYGNRLHDERLDYVTQLTNVIQSTFDKGGNLVIPSFAVGRTQELLYLIRIIKDRKLIKGHDDFPVYVDSPLAVEATEIYLKDMREYFDDETLAILDKGINPITFDGLKLSVTSDDSKLINDDDRPKIILSASGMCEAGRIKHHLKHNLWRKECTVLFVGYQAINTLGRSLCEGAEKVKIFGEDITVLAEIEILPGISGHADKAGLDKWITNIKDSKKVFVIHGESNVSEEYTNHLRDDLNIDAYCPYSGGVLDLITGEFINAEPVITQKKERLSTTYQRLTASLDRLSALVSSSRGLTNKELSKLTDSINNLCSKWE